MLKEKLGVELEHVANDYCSYETIEKVKDLIDNNTYYSDYSHEIPIIPNKYEEATMFTLENNKILVKFKDEDSKTFENVEAVFKYMAFDMIENLNTKLSSKTFKTLLDVYDIVVKFGYSCDSEVEVKDNKVKFNTYGHILSIIQEEANDKFGKSINYELNYEINIDDVNINIPTNKIEELNESIDFEQYDVNKFEDLNKESQMNELIDDIDKEFLKYCYIKKDNKIKVREFENENY